MPRLLRALRAVLTTAALSAALWSLPPTASAAAAAPERTCTLPSGLAEISGLAMSTRHPGVFYAVNDSGNTNQVFAIDCSGATGQLKATFTLSGATNTDWEGLAVGKDTAGRPAVLVGDIGDNLSSRSDITVYSFPEPEQLVSGTVTPTAFRFAYADGKHDAESLLADPTTGQLYVASKLIGAAGKLYRAPLPPQPGQVNTLTPVRDGPVFATDGAFSPTGQSYVLRSGGPLGPNTAYVYSSSGTKLAEVALPSQPQGETVTYADCASLLVGSENDTQIWRVPLPAEAAPGCDGTPPPPPPGDGLVLADPGAQTCRFIQACGIQITATGGQAPYTYRASGLPFGLSMNASTGQISGQPWQTGTFQITATATDTTKATAQATFPLTINWF
ncbi:putative Ig domain-containing protein [Streptomyces gobiensis]|uniref:putative Ig domain-containing protein n=1 Tax=Streptomyces gobiensis TaxID=2875706 RepID=UPI001E627480|nr:putative Ig domain-containing protein [Streptomyces gobiensis]UGY94913.1 putative Ig domain-containing protein [Streptomyces gobiensis]